MTGGGSGGHITPLLSLAHELKQQEPNCQIVYIGHKGDQFDSLHASGHAFDFMGFINAGKFRRYHGESWFRQMLDFKTIALNIRDFFRVIKSIGDASRILARTQPDVLFVKGGFVSVPVGIAARLKRIPIITHDSDTIGGLANRIVGRWAKVHTTGMPTDLYNYKSGKVEYVGIPLDENIRLVTPPDQLKFKHEIGIPKDALVLMVSGGGNGSQRLNELMLATARDLLNHLPHLHILHLTGHKHIDSVVKGYHAILTPGQRARIHPQSFVGDFYKYSGAADLIVSRAGASTIAEFATQAKACIIIPSPYLAAGHQLKNAELLEDKQAALVLAEQGSDEVFVAKVMELLSDRKSREQLAHNLHKMAKPGAAKELAQLVLTLAKKEP
jgi:UDP-N-acetylglucosamine--N-acetylmuramyl-(pentapeptide) pyrophosphoryl-undecaprenol N-acetylglucosamine transferase